MTEDRRPDTISQLHNLLLNAPFTSQNSYYVYTLYKLYVVRQLAYVIYLFILVTHIYGLILANFQFDS